MTHEETIRAAYDAWNRSDIDRLLIEMRDGLVFRLQAFRDRAAAMDALEAT
jgi:hypothetical protein